MMFAGLGISGPVVLVLFPLLLGGQSGLVLALRIQAVVVGVAVMWWDVHGRIRQ
jgi:hypothetical protein